MKKTYLMFLVVVLVILGMSAFQPALVLAADEAKAPADSAAKPAAPAAAAPAADAPADAAAKANYVAPADEEGSDDVAVLKEAAKELRAAGKTAIADKVDAIASGMDW